MAGVLLVLDFMIGVADQPFATAATKNAAVAVDVSRNRGSSIIFTKVGFRPGHPEVSANNKVFGALLGTDRLVGISSQLVDTLVPRDNEPVLDKKRFSAFAGSGLWTVMRATGATSVAICGLSTSGVVLSTALELIDADFDVTILADACADPEIAVHHTVIDRIFAQRAFVCSVDEWASPQPAARASA